MKSEILAKLPYALQVEIEENLQRKDYSENEKAKIQQTIKKYLIQFQHQGVRSDIKTSANYLAEVGDERADATIGNIFDESKETVRRRRVVFDAIEKHPKKFKRLKESLDKGERNITSAFHQVNSVLRKHVFVQLPEGDFNCLYIDPPWTFEQDSGRGAAKRHYKTMSLEDIKNLKVPASKDSVLFLWVPSTLGRQAFDVIDTWGFEFHNKIAWDKMIIGSGSWFRNQHEDLWLCTKGDIHPPPVDRRISNVVRSKRQHHSKKPDIFYKLIERMYPNMKYLEMFARNKREGWTSWGDEV